eukprot:4846060-Amphidinium_carterae.1
MPCYKKVPEEYRVRRFQLGKLKLMMRDIEEEKAEIRRLAAEEDEAIANTLREAEHAPRHITAEALSQLGDDTVPRDNDLEETAAVAEALSPKHMGDVDEHGPLYRGSSRAERVAKPNKPQSLLILWKESQRTHQPVMPEAIV